jgi:hypothetical protein
MDAGGILNIVRFLAEAPDRMGTSSESVVKACAAHPCPGERAIMRINNISDFRTILFIDDFLEFEING